MADAFGTTVKTARSRTELDMIFNAAEPVRVSSGVVVSKEWECVEP